MLPEENRASFKRTQRKSFPVYISRICVLRQEATLVTFRNNFSFDEKAFERSMEDNSF